ncbi:MAG: SOS response-associated peptidase [Bacteroidetes bacterium]|nr:SOS response-associated peptidase [Bacteroidota bacterium]
MCGRYNLITDAQAIVDFFEVENSLEIEPRYNIAPSQNIPVIRQKGEIREISLLHWGLIPHWAKDKKIGYRMINARAETVAGKPSFRAAFRQRRCLIPATGFYEWQLVTGGKQPYNIQIGEGKLFAFAGLWESWKGGDGEVVESCTIIVTDANDVVRPIHDRMPVILHPADYGIWLDSELHDQAVLQPLLGPCPSKWITCYPVSRRVGSPANDGPGLVKPLIWME